MSAAIDLAKYEEVPVTLVIGGRAVEMLVLARAVPRKEPDYIFDAAGNAIGQRVEVLGPDGLLERMTEVHYCQAIPAAEIARRRAEAGR
ncbi:hypothetical protein DB346_24350 [Verrucomicrobia bacterium LW23]|nr:hypothetical protein DB346_24350 [Verrucomicrobia bacterium LW23]